MKRILYIIAAGCLALLAFSCAKVEEKAVVDISKATAPVLQSFTAEDDIVVTYTPAVFTMGFNEKMATYHTLAMVSVEGKASNVTLSTKNDGSHLTLTRKTLVNALKVRGFEPLDVVSVELVVRGAIQDPSKGITNAFVDSEGKATVSVEMPEEAAGCPYEEYTESSNWSVIGALSAYGINWDGDLNMWTDGNGNYVAAHVVLKAADEVKFRQDLAWTVNVGGEFGGLDAEFAVAQDGANIKVGADGVYDLYYFSGTGTALVTAAFDPYPEFVEESNWSVIGALPNYGINWDGDITMVSDGSVSAAFGVSLTADDEFKFRQDKAWTVNLGGEFGGLDADFAVAQDGANIKVGAAGVYDLFVDPANMTAKIATPSGLKVSSVIVPEVDKPKAWSLAGTMEDSGWAKDYDLENVSGDTWQIRNFPLRAIDEFKIRADHAWDISLGGPEENAQSIYEEGNPYGIYQAVLGETFAAGDKNISVGTDGNYNITLTYGDEPTILIEEYKEYPDALYMIGDDFGNWNWDSEGVVEMTPVFVNDAGNGEGQFWTIRYISAEKGFKFNSKKAWGGDFCELTTNDGYTAAGGNCYVAESGIYMVHVDLKASKLHVEPARVYGIGNCFGGWTEGMEEALFVADGQTLKATAAKAGEIRMYAASAIANTDWWTREFVFFDGKIAYRGKGGDQERVNVNAGQTIVLNFNEGTASVEGEGEAPTLPQTMYIVGEAIIGWNDFVPMHAFHSQDGMFWIIRYLEAGKQFKFSPEAAWSGDFYKLDTNEGFEIDGTNCKVTESGIYCIGVDCDNSKIIVEPAKVYGIGDAFGGWDVQKVAFQVEGQTLVGTATADGNIRTYVDSKILSSVNDWWHAEFIPMDGSIVYREKGGDPAAVAITAGQKITYDFNAGTGTIESAAVSGITIDGNLSDWDGITAFSSSANSRIREWKYSSDAENVYFYFAMRKNRVDSGRKLVIGFDIDETGSLTDNNNLKSAEAIARNIIPFTNASGATELTVVTGTDAGSEVVSTSGEASTGVVNVYAVAGTEDISTDSSNAYVELSIPKAKLGLPAAGTTIKIGASYDYYFAGWQEITL